MTRIVVMDEELHEALTVIEVAASWLRAIAAGHASRTIRLPRQLELVPVAVCYDQGDPMISFEYAEFRLEPVCRGRDPRPLFWYAYALTPEAALDVRSAFLPGQLSEVTRREREAYWRGVFLAPPV